MKVRRNLLIAFSLLSLSVNAQRIKGSDTVLPVAQQTAERYMNQHPDARVTVTGGGTGVGISALMDNTTDIAMSSSLSMPATGAIIQSVSQTKGAIGYVGLAYVSPRIKTLSVSYDGSHYATPSVENATNKTYPIVRPLYYYYNVKNKEAVTPLIQFILSPEGQEIIKKSGYIPIK